MSTKIIITGTGVPFVAAGRAGPGVYLEHDGTRLQFDAGRATTLRLAEAGVRTPMLDALFVTHHHSDHLSGLTDLILTRWIESAGTFAPLRIVYPSGALDHLLGTLLDPWTDDIEVRTTPLGRTDHPAPTLQPFDAEKLGTTPQVVWSTESVTVSTCTVRHQPVSPSVGYRINTPDGDVAISGDTTVCPEVATLADGAAVLVHEVFCRSAFVKVRGDSEFAEHMAKTHADAIDLGRMASGIGVPRLVLTHLIPAPGRGPVTAQMFIDDVRNGGFTGEVIVAEDLTTVEL